MTSSPRIVTALVIGAGGRGMTYALFSKLFPERLRIIGVAEPKEYNRNFMVETYGLAPENVATDWHALAERPKFADAVFICTQDAQHAEPAIAFARKGYAILLEKPMAPNEEDCFRIVEAAKEAGVIFGVCHVLRYTSYTQTLKKLVDSGAVGEIVNIQHLEPVGYWHQAHSFVRGNWGNEKRSSFMLLSKSCHDLDWISYMMGEPCKSLSSFGSLKHFKKSEKPVVAGEATRCVGCAYEPQCPYSAKKIYLGRLERGETGWPVDVLTLEPTIATVLAALETGPYGRCVYECDNDVVDNQVVSMQFANNKTATFTMTAFNQARPRRTRIFGTRGEIYGDGNSIQLFDFLTDELHDIPIEEPVGEDGSAARLGGHGGGDYGLMDHFVSAVAENDPSKILTGPDISLATHCMVFAAERARLQHCVVDL